MAPQVNVWVKGYGWFGPSYPEAGDPPVAGAAEQDGDMPDLDELDPDDPSRAAGPDGPVPPPRSGKGSGQPAWLAYAREQGVDVDPDADRADIIAALDRADVPTG
jgi:hypothetical protein